MYNFIRNRSRQADHVKFSEVAQGETPIQVKLAENSATFYFFSIQVAKAFVEILHLKTAGLTELRQDQPYGDLIIKAVDEEMR